MTMLSLGDPLPDIALPATDGKTVNLTDLRGRYVVIYFYPKDHTPGCTQEGKEFSELEHQFAELDAVVFGVSRDSVRMHDSFKTKQGFSFDLLSDSEEKLCQLFDVIKMKNMYGKQVRGIERSTFLFAKNGQLVRAWRKVKVPDHARQVLLAVQALQGSE